MRGARTSHVRALPLIMYGTAWKEDRTQALVLEAIATGFRCRRDVCWNLIGSLRSEEDTWSGSKVNRVIGEFLGQALPSVDFAHSDLT
jgi:hypothetical protein